MLKLVVLSCVLAAATAQIIYNPLAYTSSLAPWSYSAYLQPSNYRGPLSLAPGQPADVLGADGRPLDTLDVNLDRAAHFTAKAFDRIHSLKKRSVSLIAPYAASLVTPYVAPLTYTSAPLQPYNYRGPLSLAPGQPANILGADGRPLDTLDVNLDRSAHFTAKALDGIHSLKKRSVSLIAPYAASVVTPYTAPFAYTSALLQPYNYRGPLSLAPGQPANILGADGRPLDTLDVNLDRSAHITAKALSGAHILKKRSAGLVLPISPVAVARTPLITPTYTTLSAPIAATRLTYASSYLPYAHYL